MLLFTPIKEGLIINNPQRKLPKEQRKLFEDNGWEIVDSAQPAHNSPPPLESFNCNNKPIFLLIIPFDVINFLVS